jgi:hypothetical protein
MAAKKPTSNQANTDADKNINDAKKSGIGPRTE